MTNLCVHRTVRLELDKFVATRKQVVPVLTLGRKSEASVFVLAAG
jgi:hypothetical protein